MKIKYGLRGASIILLTILLILPSAVAITNKESIIQGSYTNYIGKCNKDIFWDNNMSYDGTIQSQYDASINLDAYTADDFQFNFDTNINDVHWVGGYWFGDYQNADFNWSILFYLDRGDGNAPGDVFAGPFNFTSSEITKIFIWDYQSWITYELSVNLPNFVKFAAGKKYWISIWGIGSLNPYCGVGFHYEPITLHKALMKSFYYFNDSEWHDIEDLGGQIQDPVDLCFQLFGIWDDPPLAPTIDGPKNGKTGKIYPYSFTSTDPDGDQVSYYIDWGDGTTSNWTPLQASGITFFENHTWTTKGTYTITCKAKDEHGLEGNSTRLEVKIPRNKEFTNNKNDKSTKTLDQFREKIVYVLRGLAAGNASGGKLIGFRDKIAIINFDYLEIAKFKFFPPRWEYSDFWDVKAIFFNVNQTITNNSFYFEEDWVIAIVFQLP
jgi:hypothetical protein